MESEHSVRTKTNKCKKFLRDQIFDFGPQILKKSKLSFVIIPYFPTTLSHKNPPYFKKNVKIIKLRSKIKLQHITLKDKERTFIDISEGNFSQCLSVTEQWQDRMTTRD